MSSTEPPEDLPQDREAALFEIALEKTGAEREALLRTVAAGDPALQSRLRALLAAHEQDHGVLGDDEPAESLWRGRKAELADALPEEAVGQTIGRYKLQEKVGEGGCGVVYVAEQTEPVRRRVALKVIKLGMDTRAVVARFEAERQALALMDHPNIARVFDAGSTRTGRPYFVMELVRGIRITDYCDQNHLSTETRLNIFIQICHAIQHAHQKGIIHRDIKPSNILVTVHDPGSPGVPKVIDFGIAKATEGRLTETTLYTQLNQLIGTPAYMSPEQAEMSGPDVDTRSDIYSLGALLYELLTGRTPFDAQQLMSAGIDAMRRTIRETEPLRPSTRLATLKVEDLTTTAKRRAAEAPRLISLLKGDLDWVVMKCLEKDRTRRYETANGLAADLRRHLKNEPVVARPPSKLYRFQKSVQRNKLAFAAAIAVVIALVSGLSTAVYSLAQEKVSRRRAEAAEREEVRLRQVAEEREQTSRQNLYAVDMNLAQQALRGENFQRASDLIERQRPAANGFDLRHWEWRYLWQICRGEELCTLGRHSNVVTCLALAPVGNLVASGSYDGTVRLWNLASRQLLATARPGPTFAVVFSPDGKRVAGATERGVTLWASGSLEPLANIEEKALVRALCFTPDGERLAFFCSEGAIRLWDPRTSHPGASFSATQLNGSLRGALAFSPRGDLLAVGENSGLIRLLDPVTGAEKRRLVGHRNSVTGLVFAPAGNVLASSAWDSTVRLWDVSSGQERLALTNHTAWVSAVAFAAGGHMLATASADQSIRIWDAVSGAQLARLQGHRSEIWALAASPDGGYLISGGKDETIKIWRGTPRRRPSGTNALPERVTRLAFASDGRYVSLLATDGKVVVGDPVSRQVLWQVSGEPGDASAVAFAPHEPILAIGDTNGHIQFWNPSSRRLVRRLAGHTNAILTLHFSADGRSLCSIDRRGIYKCWDDVAGIETASGDLLDWQSHLRPLDFSPDHQRVAFSVDRTLHVIRLGTTNETATFPLQKEPIRWVAFAPDGRCLATGEEDGTARLWDPSSGRQLGLLRAHRLGVHVVAFSPDGRRLLSGGGESDVKLWDLQTRQEVLSLEPVWPSQESAWLEQLGFSPDGHAVWAIDRNFRWQFWRAPSFAEISAAER